MNWYFWVFRKYAQFSGRSQRKEYWFFQLFSVIISFGLEVIDYFAGLQTANGIGELDAIYALIVLIPGLAVAVRRLHDTNRSGWWMLVILIPIIGWIGLLIMFCQDSEARDNRFGPNPKASGPFNPAPVL